MVIVDLEPLTADQIYEHMMRAAYFKKVWQTQMDDAKKKLAELSMPPTQNEHPSSFVKRVRSRQDELLAQFGWATAEFEKYNKEHPRPNRRQP